MSEWTKNDSTTLTDLLTRVRDKGDHFWPLGSHQDLINEIVCLPAAEVALTRCTPATNKWEVLLQFREFSKEPAWFLPPYNNDDWYLPGGYFQYKPSTLGNCLYHLGKDLRKEYERAGIVGFDLKSIKLATPVLIGGRKWMPKDVDSGILYGEHPIGAPQSNVYVCELIAGEIVETPWLKWTSEPVVTKVPLHTGFIKGVLFYLNSPPEMKKWMAEMHALIATG